MSVKPPFWFWLFLIAIVVAVFYHRVHSYQPYEPNKREALVWNDYQLKKLYGFYLFKLSPKGRESAWSDALSKKMDGLREKHVSSGRIDVLTQDLAIEVEKIDKWHEGIGQALHYGLYSGKHPTLAIITYPPRNQGDKDTLDVIEKVCEKYDIRLIMMMPQ